MRFSKLVIALLALRGAFGAEVRINLPGQVTVSRKSVNYRCDSAGVKMGLPEGAFTVEYINAGSNSLAIVPISGQTLIFSNVVSGSGARYVARQFTWWEARGRVSVYSDSLAGKAQGACTPVAAK